MLSLEGLFVATTSNKPDIIEEDTTPLVCQSSYNICDQHDCIPRQGNILMSHCWSFYAINPAPVGNRNNRSVVCGVSFPSVKVRSSCWSFFNNAISTFSPWPTFHFRKWISKFDSLCNTIKRYPLWPGLELDLNPFGIFLLHRRYFPLGWLNWITRQQKNKTIWLVVGKLINPIRKRNQLGNDRIWVVPFPNCRVRFTKLSG